MRERNSPHPDEGCPPTASLNTAQRRAVHPTLASGGQPLDTETRAQMSVRFGHDFSQVRVHTDARAVEAAAALDAHAYAVGSDLVFGEGAYNPSRPQGRFVLAHELAHVVQNERFGPAAADVSAPGDASEREASAAAATVLGGGRASVCTPSAAAVARFEIGDVWNAVDAVNPLSVVTNPLSGILRHGLAGEEAHEASIAGSVQQAEDANDHDIDAVQHGVADGARSLARLAHGIPVLGGLADLGAAGVDQVTQVPAGLLHGVDSMAGGLMSMAVDPLGTARGLEQTAEHISPLPGLVPNPLAMAHHALNAATGCESAQSAVDHSLNPRQVQEDDARFWEGAASHMVDPYRRSIAQGRDGEVAGRALFDIGGLFIGSGEARTAGEAADVGRAATDVTRATEATADATRATEATADAAREREALPTAAASTGYARRGAELVGAGRETVPALPSPTGYAQRGSELAAGRETMPPPEPVTHEPPPPGRMPAEANAGRPWEPTSEREILRRFVQSMADNPFLSEQDIRDILGEYQASPNPTRPR